MRSCRIEGHDLKLQHSLISAFHAVTQSHSDRTTDMTIQKTSRKWHFNLKRPKRKIFLYQRFFLYWLSNRWVFFICFEFNATGNKMKTKWFSVVCIEIALKMAYSVTVNLRLAHHIDANRNNVLLCIRLKCERKSCVIELRRKTGLFKQKSEPFVRLAIIDTRIPLVALEKRMILTIQHRFVNASQSLDAFTQIQKHPSTTIDGCLCLHASN